jgi:hypothetical protein
MALKANGKWPSPINIDGNRLKKMNSFALWARFGSSIIMFVARFMVQVVYTRDVADAIDIMVAHVEHKHGIKTGATKVRPESFNIVPDEDRPEPAMVIYPANREELIHAVKTSPSFRAVGAGCNFADCLRLDDPSGRLISLAKMNRVISIDITRKRVRVQAGMIIQDLILELEKVGLALRNMGNYDKQSVGGAITGGTHGTCGRNNDDTFTSSILSLHMVSAEGVDVELGPEDSVTYGLGGIVYEVDLQLRDFYYVRQTTTILDSFNDIHVEQWWGVNASEYTMVRWLSAGTTYPIIQQVEFNQARHNEYKLDIWTASYHRLAYCLQIAVVQSLPVLGRRLTSLTTSGTSFVDTYHRQYADIPAPHHCEFEYAVPFLDHGENIRTLIGQIQGTLTHVDVVHEVHIRIGPDFGDEANGHILKHIKKAVWFNLNMVVPPGTSRAFVNSIGKRFEELIITHGGIGHPHKSTINRSSVAMAESTRTYLQTFQALYDPLGKMNTTAMKQLLQL